MICNAHFLTIALNGTRRAMRPLPGADMLAEGNKEAVQVDPKISGNFCLKHSH